MRTSVATRLPFLVLSCALAGDLRFAVAQNHATDAATRMRAWQHHLQLHETSPFKDLAWRAVGPRKQGGRIEAIACPAGEPYTMYVGVGAGNIWKTVNNGLTWAPVFEHESTFAIGAMAIAPSNADIVWAGTGEVLMARSSYAGTGVFKSTDAGKTWTNMGLHETHHIGRVVVHPTDPDVVYVAAIGHNYTFNPERGVFKTTDGGRSWSKVLYIDEKTGAVDVVMDPTDHDTLYATTWQRSREAWGHTSTGPGSGIHKTTDAGRTWTRLEGGLPAGDDVGRIAVDVAPTDPRVVYALVSVAGRAGHVYRSDDKGRSWRKVNETRLRAAYDFCEVRVSPDNENEIYVPGVRSFKSTDGGKTFAQFGDIVFRMLRHGGPVLHLDTHELWIDPERPQRVVLGNDGGLFVSYDRGATWLHVNNLPIGEFYAVTVDTATPYNIYGGTQDNAALVGPSDQVPQDGKPDPWQHIYLDRWGGGDSYFTYVDPTDRHVIYYEHQVGDLKRKNTATGKTKSIRPRAAEGERPLRRNWMTPFLLSRYDARTLYYGAERLFKSTDRGDTWTAISGDLSSKPGPDRQGNVPFGTLTMISESVFAPGFLVVGTDDGRVHVTRDDGKTWTRIDGGLPDKWVSRVIASRHDERTIYVALTGYREDDFSAYLYKSADLGGSWTSIAANLPAESINVVREDPHDARILYVGTELGVYGSTDTGRQWRSLCANLPTTPVHDLVIHPRDNEMVVGTHGRSIFVLDVKPVQRHAERIEN